MKRPVQKFIAFSTALVSMIGFMAPVSAAMYESELMEKCEYDELFEMRDKAILIKDGNDYTVNDNTQLVVIDSNGEKQLISKEEGFSGLYSYVTTTRGLYNFISPTCNPYSFDFFDENYCISTESGAVIAGFGDKSALINESGKKISAEYDAIYRISDDYFMVDIINGEKRSTGLIKADGSVIVTPAEGIGEFYLCGNKFLVSEYTTEIVEEENWDGEIVQKEKTVYSYYFMSTDGKAEAERFKSFSELGHDSTNKSDNYHYGTDNRYDVNYTFDSDYICLKNNDDTKCIYNSKTETFSNKYTGVEFISTGIFLVSHDGVYDVIDSGFKPVIKNAEKAVWDSWGKRLEIRKDGMVTTYDRDLNVLKESAVTKRFPTFSDASVEQNGNIITVNSDDTWYSNGLDEDFVNVSVNVELKPVFENSYITVSLRNDYDSDFDFELEVLEEYYDEAEDYTVTTSSRYKYILDSDYVPHDVSEYKKVVKNLNHDIVILQKEDNHLEYVNFADANDKKDLSPYINITACVYDYNTNQSQGYILKTEDTFVVCDMDFNLLTEPVKGVPSNFNIKLNNNVYSGDIIYYVNAGTDENGEAIRKYGDISLGKGIVVPAEYDSVSIGYGGYLVKKDGITTILSENGEFIKDFEGEYKFNSITGCVYDANWNLVKRENNVTSNIVYNIDDNVIKYQQTGKYDDVSYFVDDYAVVINYSENSNDHDELWLVKSNNSYGIINIDGTEVVKPSDSLNISMNPEFGDADTSFNVYAYSATEEKNYKKSFVKLSVKELDTGYINANNMTVAKMTSDNRYIALVNGLWGVYDGDGKEVIKPQFDYFQLFNESGLIIVETPEYNTCYYYKHPSDLWTIYKTGVIDTEGNIIVEPYNNISENGITVYDTKSGSFPCELKTFVMDKYGIHVCKLVNGKPKYMTITRDDVVNDFAKANNYDIAHKEGNLYYVEKDGLSGVVSEDNEVLIPVEYFEILSFRPSDINFMYVRPELQGILEKEFSSKSNEISDDSRIVYVKTTDDKVGAYKLTKSDDVPVTTTTANTTTTVPETTTTVKTTTIPVTTATTSETTTVPVTTSLPASTTKPVLIGDIAANGQIDLYDAIEIARYMLGIRKFTAEEMIIADYNGDGKVDLYDAVGIAKKLLEKKLLEK